MKYCFVLGHNPTISIAEILTVFDGLNIDYTIKNVSEEVLILDFATKLTDEKALMGRLGGTIKIAEVIAEKEYAEDLKVLDESFATAIGLKEEEEYNQKIVLGISVYFLIPRDGAQKKELTRKTQKSLFDLKKAWTKKGLSLRIVTPPPGKSSLDSAALYNNKLLSKGGEILALVGASSLYIAKTLAVQDFKSYSLRDFGRPRRDMKQGMMPPKLAQIILNLAHLKMGDIVLDPFCGTGVVIQEALLAGYKAIGSDFDDKILEFSRKNLEWLKANYTLKNPSYELFKRDATTVSKVVANNSIDAIVTEGTLGPKYSDKIPGYEEITHNFRMLELLYVAAFREFKNVLKNGSRIVITLPFYRLKDGGKAFAPFIDKLLNEGYNTIYAINDELLRKNPVIHLTDRGTILYERPDQKVGREIVIFAKK